MSTASRTQELEPSRQRLRILRLAAFALFILIVLRLGWLQLARGSFYLDLSEDNCVQGFRIRAPRGLLMDRNGEILADNRASLSITLSRTKERDDQAVANVLATMLDLENEDVAEKFEETRARYYGSVTLIEDAGFEHVARVEERRSELPGVKVEVTAVRRYSEDPMAAHALGYVSEISEPELASMEPLGYAQGDVVGKTGIERKYELLLRGGDGAEYWVCDAAGRELYPFLTGPSREAKPGHNLILTIDAAAQRAAEAALAEFEAGAVVALEPRTGEVLVIASHPSADPNALLGGLPEDEWQELASSPLHPLMNRTIQAVYPPGSPFKLVTAAVGLETDAANRHDRVFCRGSYKYGRRTFRCWKPEGHGSTDIMKGIVESCDVFFYQLGAELGVAELMDWTLRSGFGRRTGIDIGGELGGNVPTPSWYDRHYGKRRWSKGVVINLAIGQGELLVTPLQAACLVSGIVNGGAVQKPHLLKRVETYSGRTIGTARSTVAYRLPYEAETLAFLKTAMVNAVESPRGTGRQARVGGIEVGGKTGTAQNPHGEDHSWFVSFAPARSPVIVVSVLVEHAGSGGAVAAPMARKVMRAYLRMEEPDASLGSQPTGAESDGQETAPGL